MTETLTIQLSSSLKHTLGQKCQALKIPVDQIVERLIQDFVDNDVSQTKATHHDEASLNRFIAELVKNVEISDDDLFFGDLTVKEYFALPDDEREALWTKAYLEELDKTESQSKERDVSPSAIPAGQRRSEEMRRRLNEHRKRHTSNR
jgi:hypothetical protein